jgi:hypothetical protein
MLYKNISGLCFKLNWPRFSWGCTDKCLRLDNKSEARIIRVGIQYSENSLSYSILEGSSGKSSCLASVRLWVHTPVLQKILKSSSIPLWREHFSKHMMLAGERSHVLKLEVNNMQRGSFPITNFPALQPIWYKTSPHCNQAVSSWMD